MANAIASGIRDRLVGCLVLFVLLAIAVPVADLLAKHGVPITEENFWSAVIIAIFVLPIVVVAAVLIIKGVVRGYRGEEFASSSSGSKPKSAALGVALVMLLVFGFIMSGLRSGTFGPTSVRDYLAQPSPDSIQFLELGVGGEKIQGSVVAYSMRPGASDLFVQKATFHGTDYGGDLLIDLCKPIVFEGVGDPQAWQNQIPGKIVGSHVRISVIQMDYTTVYDDFAATSIDAYNAAISALRERLSSRTTAPTPS